MKHRSPHGARFGTLLLVSVAACGGGSAPEQQSGGQQAGSDFVEGGRFLAKPDGSGLFRLDDNFAGRAEEFRIVDMFFGRLVTVQDHDDSDPSAPVEAVQFRDFVIGQTITSDGLNYRLEANPVTQESTLTILARNDPDDSNDEFDRLLERAASSTNAIFGRAPDDVPPYPLIARNGALVVRFSDALDHASVDSSTIQLLVGNPPVEPFEARVLPDPNHGALVDIDGVKQFRSTRVIVDTTVSPIESAAHEPPLAANTLGLPASPEQSQQANVLLRIPGRTHFGSGQFGRLENLARHGISVSDAFNGPVDAGSPTLDVVRAMRSGSLADESNGFLVDLRPPQVLGEQAVRVVSAWMDPAVGSDGRFDFVASLVYESAACAMRLSEGDILRTAGGFFAVIGDSGDAANSAIHVRVRSLQSDGNTVASLVGPGSVLSTFDLVNGDPPECFVTFVPAPELPPTAGVSPTASLRVRFSEPLDPASITAFDTFMVTSKAANALPSEVVVGRILESADLQTFTFSPVLPFPHEDGVAEGYTFDMNRGNTVAVDLAGNTIGNPLPQVSFRLDVQAETVPSAGHVLRFHRQDEDGLTVVLGSVPNTSTFTTPEIRGQFLYDLEKGVIRPRSVSRFQSVADRTQPVPSLMNPVSSGVQTPLSPLGSRLMTVWRYVDFNYALKDESLYNLDVEGMAWAPANGQVIADSYEQFQIALAHGNRFPDEMLGAATNLPAFPGSGLRKNEWDSTGLLGNLLDDPLNVPMKVVHEKQKGYTVNPADLYTSSTGTKLMPFPLNEGTAPKDHTFYTWRDTAILGTGAPEGTGVDPGILLTAGLTTAAGRDYGAGQVPSIGLPLLMDFRCYPSNTGAGNNAFDVSLAVNSSGQPNFRLFATGGTNINQDVVTKDPDTVPRPTGGFDPLNSGQTTKGFDNVFYHGALDIVVRVSRVVTTWIDSGGEADWSDPVLEPSVDEQPNGTEIVLDFRGATKLGEDLEHAAKVAAFYDAYGNAVREARFGIQQPVQYYPLKTDSSWVEDIDQVDGSRYVQVRLTFVGNAVSGVIPELSALAIAYERL